MQKILAGSIMALLGINNAYGNQYEIFDESGSEICTFTTSVEKTSYGSQIIDRFGKVTEFSCQDWPYGSGPGAVYYMEGPDNNSPSALESNADGVPPYFHENMWKIGNVFYGEELHFDFSTKTWTRFDSHQRVVKSGGFKVQQIPYLGSNQKTVVCKLNDSEGVEAGVGVYTYDSSIPEHFHYDGRPFVTNYATKLYVYAHLKAGEGWNGGDYMYNKVIKDIWAGDDPGGFLFERPPLNRIKSGWTELAPVHNSGAEETSFSMGFSSASEGTWKGLHQFYNEWSPETGYPQVHTNEGAFTCSEF